MNHPQSKHSVQRSSGVPPVRLALLEKIAGRIAETGAVRIGVDGVDGAGKTIFADQLADVLRAAGQEVVRISIDSFHRPRQQRYQRGRSSPDGFWLDSYDYGRFRAEVVAPFLSGGDRRHRPAIRDVASDQEVDLDPQTAPDGALLVVDGIFLHRDELADCRDYSMFLRVGFDVTFARMADRDRCPADPRAPENRRYYAGQQLYLGACDPEARADVVINNADPDSPRVV